jgi:hypothetical protein
MEKLDCWASPPGRDDMASPTQSSPHAKHVSSFSSYVDGEYNEDECLDAALFPCAHDHAFEGCLSNVFQLSVAYW